MGIGASLAEQRCRAARAQTCTRPGPATTSSATPSSGSPATGRSSVSMRVSAFDQYRPSSRCRSDERGLRPARPAAARCFSRSPAPRALSRRADAEPACELATGGAPAGRTSARNQHLPAPGLGAAGELLSGRSRAAARRAAAIMDADAIEPSKENQNENHERRSRSTALAALGARRTGSGACDRDPARGAAADTFTSMDFAVPNERDDPRPARCRFPRAARRLLLRLVGASRLAREGDQGEAGRAGRDREGFEATEAGQAGHLDRRRGGADRPAGRLPGLRPLGAEPPATEGETLT